MSRRVLLSAAVGSLLSLEPRPKEAELELYCSGWFACIMLPKGISCSGYCQIKSKPVNRLSRKIYNE